MPIQMVPNRSFYHAPFSFIFLPTTVTIRFYLPFFLIHTHPLVSTPPPPLLLFSSGGMAANHHTHHGNARDNGISPTSSIAQFTKGVAVKIVGTDNVLQRVPHLVGCIGTVREVPVHPNTWFKIEFSDGKASLPSYKSKFLTTTFSLI